MKLRTFIARNGLFTRIPVSEIMRPVEVEINFGRSILDRAVLDAIEDQSVADWFDTQDEDFCTICFISNMDPEDVVKKFKNVYKTLKKESTLGEIVRGNSEKE